MQSQKQRRRLKVTSKGEEELEQLEAELAELEALSADGKTSYGSPSPEKKENIFKFFMEVLNLKESWKVGNLKDEEIGKIRLGVRSYLELARYAEAEGLQLVSSYFTDKARIVSDPTLGRKGFFLQTSVTQIKKEQKLKEPSQKKKGLFFGGKKDESEQ